MLNLDDIINKVHQGDCEKVMADFPDECIDLVVTSPPYDNLRNYNGYSFNFKGIAKQLFRVIKQGGVVVWVVADSVIDGSESGTSFKQALFFKEIGFNLHDTMIYEHNCVFPDTNRYLGVFDYMFIFSKEKPKTVNFIFDRKNIYVGKGKRSSYREKDGTMKVKTGKPVQEEGRRNNIWRIPAGYMVGSADKITFEHPATFPEKLARDHIKSWSKDGDIVLDPFNGSGTTTKMAKQLNRKYIGIEISEEYIKIAEQRLRQDILL